ncbi:DUF4142 domain-containing protein [Pedobacter sp. JCM 36344]|uniref:DUF4142 domain-containing protein n=1 Tax=Pedobacter sp. JCM 36344 TaxID=3374280 RepID=UPI003979F864
MKTSFKFPAIFIAAVMFQSCSNSETKNRKADTTALDSIRDSTIANSTDHSHELDANNETIFLNAAAVGGLMEIETATAAASQSKNPAVKEFAMLMRKDHDKANQEVAILASKLSIAIPKSLPDEQAQHLMDLKKLNDNKFDQQYITMMLSDHAEAIKIFSAGKTIANVDVQAFATKTLSVIQSHYDKAVAIAKTLNLSNVGRGDDLQGVSPSAGQ